MKKKRETAGLHYLLLVLVVVPRNGCGETDKEKRDVGKQIRRYEGREKHAKKRMSRHESGGCIEMVNGGGETDA